MIAFFGFQIASALDFVPLEPNAFPGVDTSTGVSNLANFLGQMFKFGIALAVALAVIMCIWGGIEYMTTDSWQKKSGGQKKINDSLKGLALALSSYLILYLINPNLVDFSNNTVIGGLPATSTTTPLIVPVLAPVGGPTGIGTTEWYQAHPCDNCVPVSSVGLVCKDDPHRLLPCQANQILLLHVKKAIDSAAVAGVTARITEGWPVTISHPGCHDKGLCVDIAPYNTSDENDAAYKSNVNNIRALYIALVTTYDGVNLAQVLFESPNCSDYPFISTTAPNFRCIASSETGATGGHFHVKLTL